MKKFLASAAVVATAAALAVPAFAATRTVKVGDDFFVRNGGATVTVKRGTTVKWVWTGSAPHNVVVTSGPTKFKSNVMQKGSFAKKVTRKGTYRIICTIHQPEMKMTLKVT